MSFRLKLAPFLSESVILLFFLQNQFFCLEISGFWIRNYHFSIKTRLFFIKIGVLTQNFWYFFLETNVFFRYQTNDFLKYWNQIKTTEKLKKTTKNRRIFEDIWRKIVRNGLIGSHKNSFCLHFWCFLTIYGQNWWFRSFCLSFNRIKWSALAF